jgi:hypothetical protein
VKNFRGPTGIPLRSCEKKRKKEDQYFQKKEDFQVKKRKNTDALFLNRRTTRKLQ